jgi:hypothetical protein
MNAYNVAVNIWSNQVISRNESLAEIHDVRMRKWTPTGSSIKIRMGTRNSTQINKRHALWAGRVIADNYAEELDSQSGRHCNDFQGSTARCQLIVRTVAKRGVPGSFALAKICRFGFTGGKYKGRKLAPLMLPVTIRLVRRKPTSAKRIFFSRFQLDLDRKQSGNSRFFHQFSPIDLPSPRDSGALSQLSTL